MSNNFSLDAFEKIKQFYLIRYEKEGSVLSNLILNSMSEGMPKSVIKKIDLIIPGKGLCIYNTIYMAFNRYRNIQKAEIAGVNHFDYTGLVRNDSRPFCLNLLNLAKKGKRWTLKEIIMDMENEAGLPVNLFGGGENCHHDWEADPFYEG